MSATYCCKLWPTSNHIGRPACFPRPLFVVAAQPTNNHTQPHSKLLTDLEKFNMVIKQSVSLPGSVDGLQNRDLGDELRKLKVSNIGHD